ncbi:MAG TPA: GAF domain-containing protein [Candidatus Binatia bacterium]
MSEPKQQPVESMREADSFQRIAASLENWLLTIGAERVRFYIWDRELAHSLPIGGSADRRDFDARFERALASLADQVLAAGEWRVIGPLKKDPVLGPFAPRGLARIVLIPYGAGAESLGVLAIFNAQRRTLQSHRAELDALAEPTLLALRSFSELRHFSVQNQELQKSRDQLGSIVKEVEQRRHAVEQLSQELERRAKEQEALNVIANAISQSLRRDELLEIALDKVLEVTDRERGTIRLKDPVTGEVALSAWRGFSPQEVEELLAKTPHRISEDIFASGQPLVVNDRAETLPSQSLLLQSRSVAWVPIKARQKVIGVLGVSAGRPIPFSRHEVDLLQAVGNVIGVAVQNVWLFEESQRQEEIQRLLKELSQDITALDINSLFHKVTDKVREFFKVDISDIRLLDGGGNRWLVGSSGIAPDGLYNRGASMGRSRWLVKNRRPLVIPDMTKETTIALEDTVRELGIRGYMAVPFFSRTGEVIGILRALTYEPREFSPSEVDLLQQLVNGTAIALANARLFEETEQRAHEQAVLNAIAMATSQSLRLDELLQSALDKVLEVTGREQGYIRLKDPLTGNLTLVAHRGISEEFVETLLHGRVRGGKSDQVFESGEPLVINDTEGSILKEQTRREGSRSMSWFPLKVRGRTVGIMNVSTTRFLPFQPREVELLKAIGNVIGVALENGRLFQETERNLERIRALREIDQAITSSLDLRTVLDVLMEKIDLVLPYSAVTVRLYDREAGLLEPVACRNLDEKEWKESQWRGGRGIANVVFETKAPLIILNAQADGRVRDAGFYRKHKLTSYVGVPLIVKEDILGVLGFYTKEEHEFTGQEVEFLMTLAEQAAIAIHNSQLYQEARTRETQMQETNRMLSALHAVAAAASQSPDLDRVLRAAIEKITEIFRFDATQIHVYNESADELVLGAYFERNSNLCASVQAFRWGQGIVGNVAASGKPVIFEDVTIDPLYGRLSQTKSSARLGYHFFAVFPIRGKLTSLGTVACTGIERRKLSAGEIQLLEAMTDQIAVAMENSALYEQLKQHVKELQQKTEELMRANQVKDQFLSVMSHELRTPLNVVMGYTAMIKDEVLGEVNPEQRQVLEKLMTRVRAQLTMVNSMLQATQIQAQTVTIEEEEVKLGNLLDGLKADYLAALSKPLTLAWDYPAELPTVKTDGKKLRQILENLVHNAVKFTDAGRVTISARIREGNGQEKPGLVTPHASSFDRLRTTLSKVEGSRITPNVLLEFKVEDTGRGIAPEALPIIFEKFRQADSSETRLHGGIGLGLYVAKNFAEMLGGRIEVETGVGGGSIFTVSIPCATALPSENDGKRQEEANGREAPAVSLSRVRSRGV